ncbi:MAG: ribulose-phosphate 3-epimerase [Candidatus Izemoplasmatales bacterium]
MIVAPSFLTADMNDLDNEITSVASAAWLHFDVMDGRFVPAATYGHELVRALRPKSDRFFDCHLMTVAPEASFSDYAAAGADSVTFHLEAVADPAAALSALKALGLKAGVSIKPATPVAALEPYLGSADLVLVMSVEPGRGGQRFLPAAADRIARLAAIRRARGLDFLIEVDGGINAETAEIVRAAGADVVVAGSFIFNRADRENAIAELAHGRQG